MKKLLILSFIYLAAITVLKAQDITQQTISTCPEMQAGKVYTGKDIRAAKANFPEGVYVNGYGTSKHYPFAKITSPRMITVLYFSEEKDSEIIHLHANTFKPKNFAFDISQSYIFSDGKATATTTYGGSISLSPDKVLTINQTENGVETIAKIRLSGKTIENLD